MLPFIGPLITAGVGMLSGWFDHKKKLVEATREGEIFVAKSKAELDVLAEKGSIELAGADAASERAKRNTYVDEILILGPILLVIFTVIDPLSAADVIARLADYPIWVQLIIVGIYVGVFGLRSIFAGLSRFLRKS